MSRLQIALGSALAALFVLLLATPLHAGSPYWMNFYGTVYRDGEPFPGADVSLTWGESGTSRDNGNYGVLPCYGDDPATPEKDGAVPGDTITFYVNGEAVATATWTAHGALQRVDLHVSGGEDSSTCEDGYEPSNTVEQAKELTGPERHTFFLEKGGADVDWVKFRVSHAWVYQLKATVSQFSPTDPVLKLFDEGGTLLAENDNYFNKNAEIWYWNSGRDGWVYAQASEAHGLMACGTDYTIELIPWAPVGFSVGEEPTTTAPALAPALTAPPPPPPPPPPPLPPACPAPPPLVAYPEPPPPAVYPEPLPPAACPAPLSPDWCLAPPAPATLPAPAAPTLPLPQPEVVHRIKIHVSSPEPAVGVSDCEDSYEPSDSMEQAKELTGPELHTFTTRPLGADADFVKFRATHSWVYQLRATVAPISSIDPALKLFDGAGTLLAENNDYFEKNAEIWYWNGGEDQWLYARVHEVNGKLGCGTDYTIELVPWSPGEFAATFQ